MRLPLSTFMACFVCMLFVSTSSWAETIPATNPTLKAHVDALSTRKGQVIAGNFILGAKFLQKFYKHNQYRRVWINAKNITALRQAIRDSWEDGLQLKDFHARALGIGDGSSPASQTKLTNVQRDILLSDAFVRLLYQLFYGKVDPERLDPNWNVQHALPSGDPVDIISNALANNKVEALINKARVKHPYYQNMQEVLKIYTYSAAQGKWPTVPTKLALKPGQTHKAIPLFRKRLAIYDGQPTKNISQSELYDKELAKLVRIFQKNHGLDADGVLGPATTKELNVPAQKRVDQIRVNMERARWAIRTLSKEKDLVLVNIAGFYLHVFFK